MSCSQSRIKFLVATGTLGASFLAAKLSGCQSGPGGQMPGAGLFGQTNQNQAPGGQAFAHQGNGQPFGQQMAGGQPMPNDHRQAFLGEMQRQGTQQGLTPQDVVAMSRSGIPPVQI